MNGGYFSVDISTQCGTPGDYDFYLTKGLGPNYAEQQQVRFNMLAEVPPEDAKYFSQALPDLLYNIQETLQVAGCAVTAGATVMHYHGERWGLDPATDTNYPGDAVVNYNDSVKYKWTPTGESFGAFLIDPDKGADYARDQAGAIISGFTGNLLFGKASINTAFVEAMGREDRKGADYLPFQVCAWGPQILQVKPASSHFVVALGRTDDAGTWTWKIHDPGAVANKTLAQGYGNTYSSKRLFRHVNDVREMFPRPLYHIDFSVYSPAELLVTDPQGNKTGLDPRTNTAYDDIYDSFYESWPPISPTTGKPANAPSVKTVTLVNPMDGDYTIQVIGTCSGEYHITARSDYVDTKTEYLSKAGWLSITAGEVHQYAYEFKAYSPPAVGFTGGYDGGGQKPSDVNKFLRYVTPVEARTHLPAGPPSYSLTISYGVTVNAATFTAAMDGVDIKGLFKPAAGTLETVSVPVGSGSHTLVLSINGLTASGRTATDTDRLTFLGK
jgi:hypothetical protein